MNNPQRVLCIEDEIDIQNVAKLALEKLGGFEVKICSSGSQAIKEAEDFTPDIILLDVMMPGMDGPATLKALRSIKALAQTPVAFMTAKVQPSEIQYLKSLGAKEVIAKPFDPMTLPDRVREII